MTRKKEQVRVLSQEQLAAGIFSMWIATEATPSGRLAETSATIPVILRKSDAATSTAHNAGYHFCEMRLSGTLR